MAASITIQLRTSCALAPRSSLQAAPSLSMAGLARAPTGSSNPPAPLQRTGFKISRLWLEDREAVASDAASGPPSLWRALPAARAPFYSFTNLEMSAEAHH